VDFRTCTRTCASRQLIHHWYIRLAFGDSIIKMIKSSATSVKQFDEREGLTRKGSTSPWRCNIQRSAVAHLPDTPKKLRYQQSVRARNLRCGVLLWKLPELKGRAPRHKARLQPVMHIIIMIMITRSSRSRLRNGGNKWSGWNGQKGRKLRRTCQLARTQPCRY